MWFQNHLRNSVLVDNTLNSANHSDDQSTVCVLDHFCRVQQKADSIHVALCAAPTLYHVADLHERQRVLAATS